MDRTTVIWMLALALIVGAREYIELGDTPLTTPVIARLAGNMLGGALAGWLIVWFYRKFK